MYINICCVYIYIYIDAIMVVWVLIVAPFVRLLQEAKEQQGKKTRKKERKENRSNVFFRAGDVDGDGPSSTDEVSSY